MDHAIQDKLGPSVVEDGSTDGWRQSSGGIIDDNDAAHTLGRQFMDVYLAKPPAKAIVLGHAVYVLAESHVIARFKRYHTPVVLIEETASDFDGDMLEPRPANKATNPTVR
ncbi:MAG: hypothetical protein IPM64_04850 [Phycisphaerales bacterium]|nr:hypothetical protein [Phycisphaerales bacterium]